MALVFFVKRRRFARSPGITSHLLLHWDGITVMFRNTMSSDTYLHQPILPNLQPAVWAWDPLVYGMLYFGSRMKGGSLGNFVSHPAMSCEWALISARLVYLRPVIGWLISGVCQRRAQKEKLFKTAITAPHVHYGWAEHAETGSQSLWPCYCWMPDGGWVVGLPRRQHT